MKNRVDIQDVDTKNIIIKRCSSKLTIERLAENINNNNLECTQIFNPKSVINKIHLISAYLNAVNAFSSNTNISERLNIEMLLYSAMTNQINKAIKKIGADTNKDFVLFSTPGDYKKISVFIENEKEFSNSFDTQLDIAKKYNITAENEKNLNLFIMQAIALSHIKDK